MNLTELDEEFENFKALKYRMNEEGFHYCFTKYSKWDEVKDEFFQYLLKEYKRTASELETYINCKHDLLEDKLENEI